MRLQSKLSPGGAAAVGGSAGAGRGPIRQQVPRVLMLHPSAGAPSRHVLHIPHERPAETRHASLAGPSSEPSSCPRCFPRQPLPSLWKPLQKRNCAAYQRQRRLPRRPAGLWARGVCAPPCPLPGSSLCELLCGFPPPALTGLLAFFLQKRLKMSASRPSATGLTWRAPSS